MPVEPGDSIHTHLGTKESKSASLIRPSGQRGEGGMSHLDKKTESVSQLSLWAEAQAASRQVAPLK